MINYVYLTLTLTPMPYWGPETCLSSTHHRQSRYKNEQDFFLKKREVFAFRPITQILSKCDLDQGHIVETNLRFYLHTIRSHSAKYEHHPSKNKR